MKPFRKAHGPEFPLETLPEWLGVYVADVAASTQVPISMPAAFALGAIATACAGKARINPYGDWIEPLNLFIALIAPPGAKKSATVGAFQRTLERFEHEMQERAKPELRARRMERQRLEAALKTATQADNWTEAERLEEELEASPAPVSPRLIVDDVTAQKLTSVLAEQGGRITVMSAEPSIFPTMLGRWSSGKADSELDVFLKGHAGDTIKVDRLGRPTEVIASPCLTIAIALQPTALDQLSRADTAGRGLLARFVWVTAPDVRGKAKLRDSRPVPPKHFADFERGLHRLLELEPSEALLRLDAQATDAWVRFCDANEARLAPGGDLRALCGWGEKRPGLVARVAGLLHLAEHPPTALINADTIARAVRIGEWAVEHSKVVFDQMGMVPDRLAARAILEVVDDLDLPVVTRRDVHQKLKDRKAFAHAASLDAGFDLLIEGGWLTRHAAPKGPGRPSEAYTVHPEALRADRRKELES